MGMSKKDDIHVGQRIRTRDGYPLVVKEVKRDDDGNVVEVSCSIESYIPIPGDVP